MPHHEYDLEQVNRELKSYPLSRKIHAPMSRVEIYDSIWNGEPLYMIACGADERIEREEASLEQWRELY